jgi:protein-tyrosine phosphatase
VSPERVLFVCSGNTCRSPLAERLLARAARERGRVDLVVRSVGSFAGRGAPASCGASIVAQRIGLALPGHRSTPPGPDLVDWADLVVAMTTAHRRVVEEIGGAGRAVLATELLPEEHPEHGRDVADPVGGGIERYEEVLDLLEQVVEGILEGRGAGGAEP